MLRPILRLQGIKKQFSDTVVLNSVDFQVHQGESIAILGNSGSGKSTLLQICGLLDTPDSGEIIIEDQKCNSLSESEKTLIRRHKIGFIYQFHHLLAEFTVLENLIIPQLLCKASRSTAKQNAISALERFSLSHKQNSLVNELSGGEKQRVAIIRGIINNPKLIIADEPTGNLDNTNAMIAFEMLTHISKSSTLLMVTHNKELADLCSRVIFLENGNLKE